MVKVFITTTVPFNPMLQHERWFLRQYQRIIRLAENDIVGKHEVIDSPEVADIIICVGSRTFYHFDVLESKIYKLFKDKFFMFDFQDYTIPLIPGLYFSIPKHFHGLSSYKTGVYFRIAENNHIKHTNFDNAKYLYSFAGSSKTYRSARKKVLALQSPNSVILNSANPSQKLNPEEYSKLISQSKFILCPRGYCPSTVRIFEAMKAGRVPVIISDDWLPPSFINWETFSVRIPENSIPKIPSILESLEDKAPEMGQNARRAFEMNLSRERGFNWIVDNYLEIQKNQYNSRENFSDRNRFLENAFNRKFYYLAKDLWSYKIKKIN